MKTLEQKLTSQRPHKPNKLLYRILAVIFGIISKKNNVHYLYDLDVKQFKDKPVILLAQHASRNDFIYVTYGMRKTRFNIVVGYHNFFSKYVFTLLRMVGAIPKKLYAPDLGAVLNIKHVVKNGGSVLLFPEGIQSTSGSNHPVNPATIKLLKSCKLPVVLCRSEGAYKSRPRYKKDCCKGKMTYRYTMLFDEKQLQESTEEQLYDNLMESFSYNEFQHNDVEFKGKYPHSYGLDKILYICPKCKSEFTLVTHDNGIRCTHCHNDVLIDSHYRLHGDGDSVVPSDIDSWYKWQRSVVQQQVKEEHFALEGQFEYQVLDKYKLRSPAEQTVGEGKVMLNKEGLHYFGTVNGEKVEQHYDITNIPSLPFTPGQSFDLYYGNEYVCFKAKSRPLEVVKWMICSEELHNLTDPKWKKVSDDAYQVKK